MVAAISGAASTTEPQNPKTTDENSRRPPLLPSENDSRNRVQRKPKSKAVSSRYLSPCTSSSNSSSSSPSSRRYPSPLISRNSMPVPKRSVSVDRRLPAPVRPLIPDPEISAATKLLVTSTRSLSVSFQGEAFSLPISKTKAPPPSPSLRKGTQERRRSSTPSRGKIDSRGDQVENSKPSDQHRWPARNPLWRSGNSVNNEQSVPSDLTASDSDSVSSDSTSGVQELGNSRNGPRGIAVSARFWQETNCRLRRLQDPGSPISTSPVSKFPNSKKYLVEGPISCPRTISSPARGVMRPGIRPASPSKVGSQVGLSPSRGHSPSRIGNAVSTINNSFKETPSVLSFAVDVRRGKVGENRIVDAHLLRLLYNRNLQWRFVNARAEGVLLVQKRSAEKNLWNAWIAISDLRDTATKKRHRLHLLRQKLKLASVLKGQMMLLEDWASLEKDHSVSLLGAIEALKASTLRLPVGGGAIAHVLSLKDAIGSAVDVMNGMASSICLLLPVVKEVNSLVTELVKVTAKERALLEQCTDFISLLAAMQVQDGSLRTHIIQHNFVPSD